MMQRLVARVCEDDRDYARYARFYLARSGEFEESYTLQDAIAHLMTTLPVSRIMLYEDENGELAAYMQYRYDENGATVFIESAILAEGFRSSRVFYRGFGDVVRQIGSENGSVRQVQFHVIAENAYLNRLYSKFARRTGERDRGEVKEFVYETTFAELQRYLRVEEA